MINKNRILLLASISSVIFGGCFDICCCRRETVEIKDFQAFDKDKIHLLSTSVENETIVLQKPISEESIDDTVYLPIRTFPATLIKLGKTESGEVGYAKVRFNNQGELVGCTKVSDFKESANWIASNIQINAKFNLKNITLSKDVPYFISCDDSNKISLQDVISISKLNGACIFDKNHGGFFDVKPKLIDIDQDLLVKNIQSYNGNQVTLIDLDLLCVKNNNGDQFIAVGQTLQGKMPSLILYYVQVTTSCPASQFNPRVVELELSDLKYAKKSLEERINSVFRELSVKSPGS